MVSLCLSLVRRACRTLRDTARPTTVAQSTALKIIQIQIQFLALANPTQENEPDEPSVWAVVASLYRLAELTFPIGKGGTGGTPSPGANVNVAR